MKMKILIILIFFIPVFASAQYYTPQILTALPSEIQESSGIEINSPETFWTHNDSGDSARLFKIDTAGNILRILTLNVSAGDCEDLCQDNSGFYYLGDFGNNLNDRTDLRIYKFPNPDSIFTDTITPEIIEFSYPDQDSFPPSSVNQNFDCEAMFWWNDSLYLFSKNRGTSSYSKMYVLPDIPGNYVATLSDSFDTELWVTSADINPSGTRMILLSEMRIRIFSDFTPGKFFDGNVIEINMYYTQKEAVVFINDSVIYITDEYLMGTGGNLSTINLSSWINGIPDSDSDHLLVYPVPDNNLIHIIWPWTEESFSVQIFSISGNLLIRQENQNIIDIGSLSAGVYLLQIESSRHRKSVQIIRQ